MKKGITSRKEDYSQWYLDIVQQADLAENSPVRGCMIIKPHGYAIWEKFQEVLDSKFKATGHKNAYFPIFIPKSYLAREAEHVAGFAQESAVVTHYRLKTDEETKEVEVDSDAKLEEELIVRPTSETMIHSMFSKWIQSYRDLPILMNQWANVVRWEMRTRPFLRSAEFLWQEGHTAHKDVIEAERETKQMLKVYTDFAQDYLAIPVIPGEKSASERFAGAKRTYTIEAMMQDGKALQSGTSHNLGQGFSRAFDIDFIDSDGQKKYAWLTSWGLSTRMIGALIMTHSDDKGLILPPKIAPQQVVIVPIWKNEQEESQVMELTVSIANELDRKGISVEVDNRDHMSPGWKFNEWEKKGIPIRIEVGPKDVESSQAVVVRRDLGDKNFIASSDLAEYVLIQLEQMQKDMYKKAVAYRQEKIKMVNSFEELKDQVNADNDDRGFALAYWDGTAETEEAIKKETKATIRCIPFDPEALLDTADNQVNKYFSMKLDQKESSIKFAEGIDANSNHTGFFPKTPKIPADAKCVYTGNPAKYLVIIGQAY